MLLVWLQQGRICSILACRCGLPAVKLTELVGRIEPVNGQAIAAVHSNWAQQPRRWLFAGAASQRRITERAKLKQAGQQSAFFAALADTQQKSTCTASKERKGTKLTD